MKMHNLKIYFVNIYEMDKWNSSEKVYYLYLFWSNLINPCDVFGSEVFYQEKKERFFPIQWCQSTPEAEKCVNDSIFRWKVKCWETVGWIWDISIYLQEGWMYLESGNSRQVEDAFWGNAGWRGCVMIFWVACTAMSWILFMVIAHGLWKWGENGVNKIYTVNYI